ncbi:MAG: TrmH family RNA methyltransferase [Burkholderiaceae bacterium]
MVMRITSRANPNVKRWKALAQQAERNSDHNLVWVEGEHVVQEAQRAGLHVVELIQRDGANAARADATHLVTPEVMDALTQLESAPEIAAVLHVPLPGAAPIVSDCLVLDRVQDPGNVGTMLRTAWAFGVRHALLTTGCASPWSSKAMRAGQGAQFWLSVREHVDANDLPKLLSAALITTSLEGSDSIQAVDLRKPCAFVFGHEGQGVSAQINQHAAKKVRIPMPGGAESLNVAAACAICLYEQHRQRTLID